MLEHINHLENLDLDLEHDEGHDTSILNDPEILEEIANEKIILCGDGDSDRSYEGVSYVWVDPNYTGQLSLGQRKLYEILVSAQSTTIYTITTIGKLTEAQRLSNVLSCCKRLENLQAVGAINGYK